MTTKKVYDRPEDHLRVIIDPTNHYDVDEHALVEACGFLPLWAVHHELFNMPVKDAMEYAYRKQAGVPELFPMTGGQVDENGVYHYPEDPDLNPLMKIERMDETMWIYPYGIVCFENFDDSTFITRMD